MVVAPVSTRAGFVNGHVDRGTGPTSVHPPPLSRIMSAQVRHIRSTMIASISDRIYVGHSRSHIKAIMWARNTIEIGKIIRAARTTRCMSQAELARLLGTTQAWISEVEKGKDTAQIGLVLRVLAQLNVRLRADEPLNDMKPVKGPRKRSVNLDRIIENLSNPDRNPASRK